MIFDCFMFFNELDLLEIRLNTLNQIVDKFVLCEGTYTHSGKEKPLYFNLAKNEPRFSKFKDKIIHLIYDKKPDKDSWVNERSQREFLLTGLNDAKNDDIILISDIDEIINPDKISLYLNIEEPKKFRMPFYYYYFNLRLDHDFSNSIICRKYHILEYGSISNLRVISAKLEFESIENAGWHFSYFGDVNHIKDKIEALAHVENDTPEFNNIDWIKQAVFNKEDLFKRKVNLSITPLNVPNYVWEHIDTKYSKNIIELPNRDSLRTLISKKKLIGAEVGVHVGNNAINILRSLDIEKLYLIDPYGYIGWGPLTTANDKSNIERKESAHNRLKIFGDKIVWIESDLKGALSEIKEKLDFIYLDGVHKYDYLIKELSISKEIVKENGLIAGHNYETPGVDLAVQEFFKNNFYTGLNHDNVMHDQGIDWWQLNNKEFINTKFYIDKYNEFAKKYPYLDDFSPNGPHYHRTKFYLDYIDENSNVLDCGCNNGGLTKYLEEEINCQVSAFDIAALNCKRTKGNTLDSNVICGDIENIPFRSEYYDVVIAGEILEHVLDIEKAINECLRVLKDGGYFLFTLPNRDDRNENLEHINYLSIESLKKILPTVSIIENQYSLLCSVKKGEVKTLLLEKEEHKSLSLSSRKKSNKSPLISLVMIVKNEEEILEKCLNSVKDIVDEFVIVDTGSTDSTKDIIKKYGVLHEIPFENYVKTKNEALKLASGEYILWMDADEVLYQGADILRIHAEEKNYDAISTQITEGSLEDYSIISCQYDRFRLWKNRFKFVGPRVHEVISVNGNSTKDLRVLVRHEHTKSDKVKTINERFTNYVRLLKDAIANNEDVIRAWFYLGRTYKDLNQHLNAISAYLEYLSQPNISFKDEIWQAHYDLAACYKINGEHSKAIDWLNKSKSIDNRRSEVDCLIGDIYFQQQEYELAVSSYKQAIREIPRDVSLFLNPYFYSYYPKNQLVLCYYYLKQFDQSFNINKELIEETKGRDNRILNNHFWILKNKKQNIFLTLGNTPEQIYGGLIEKQGVGGVETTYLELSKELAKSEMNVFLFGSVKESHIYENVYYVPYQDIDNYWELKPDVIISSRWFDPFYHEDYSKKIIWYQDAFFTLPDNYQKIFERTSMIVCSSLWHKNYISERLGRSISKEKLKIIPLGIRKDLFEKNIERNLNQVIYSSNPDRGLESLIDMWPSICDNLSDVKLVVTYGWEGLKTWSNNSSWNDSINRLQKKCFNQAEKFGNIKFTGRLNKNDLSKIMLSSSILVYPNNFWETFCLTALEAQAAGLPIITTDIGALSTVVNREFNILLQGSPDSFKYQKDFIENLCKIINNKEDLNRRSLGNLKYIESINCDWKDINKNWVKLFYDLKE